MSGEPRFQCPDCDKVYRWKHELAGRRVRCKQCGSKMRVPDDVPAGKRVSASASTSATASATATASTSTFASADPAAPSRQGRACPSCGEALSAKAVMCVHCGFNLQTGEAMGTSVGRAIKSGGGRPRQARTRSREGFFSRASRSWEYVKISYGILWDFKQLLVFPLMSLAATILVGVSFIAPLWGTGTLEDVAAFMDEEVATGEVPLATYLIAFIYYFCNYFVIIFFNTALAACALRVCAGETPTVGYGLSLACRRLPQIVGWALIAATVGLLIKIIENAHEKVGAIIAAILGTAWTVLTYFVVPVLAAEGVGPVDAFKQALATLKKTWGESLIGNFSMVFITFLVTLPVVLVLGVLLVLAFQSGQMVFVATVVLALVAALILIAVASSAADMVFRSLLYNYATGRTIPEDVDEEVLEAAFGQTAKA